MEEWRTGGRSQLRVDCPNLFVGKIKSGGWLMHRRWC
jgi:hypothetical protein